MPHHHSKLQTHEKSEGTGEARPLAALPGEQASGKGNAVALRQRATLMKPKGVAVEAPAVPPRDTFVFIEVRINIQELLGTE